VVPPSCVGLLQEAFAHKTRALFHRGQRYRCEIARASYASQCHERRREERDASHAVDNANRQGMLSRGEATYGSCW